MPGTEAGCNVFGKARSWASSLTASFCLSLRGQKSSSVYFSTLSSHREMWWFRSLFPHSNPVVEPKSQGERRLGSQAANQSRHQRITLQLPSLPHSDQDLAPQQLPVWRHVPSPCRYSAVDACLPPSCFKQGLGCAYLPTGICNGDHATWPVAWCGLQPDSSGLILWRRLAIHTSSIQPQAPPGSLWSP